MHVRLDSSPTRRRCGERGEAAGASSKRLVRANWPTLFFFRPAATQHYEANAVGAATVSCQGVANCRQFGLGEEPSPQASMLALALLGGKAKADTLKDWCSGLRKAPRWFLTILDGVAKRESP
jgi:hypothetical protein